MRLLLEINNEWKEPEFSRDINDFNLNWSYGSMDAPADYVGEYALDFTIPRSQHNNNLFGQFFRVDKLTDPATFDPSVKLPYQIISDRGNALSTGTAYIQLMDKQNYKIYLSGGLHTVFSKALNSGWDTNKATEDDEYYLFPEYIKADKFGTYTNEVPINAPLVEYNWQYGDTRNRTKWDFFVSRIIPMLQDYDLSKVVANEIISWIPTHQGKPEGIETDKWIYKKDGIINCYPIFSRDGSEVTNPIADELKEYQMADFRSYNQQPAIYVRRIWEWYKENFEAMTGYTLQLDSGWWNDENPYLNTLWYTLPKLKRNYVLSGGTTYNNTTDSTAAALPTRQNFSRGAINAVHTTNTFTFSNGFTGGDIRVNWFPGLNVPSGESNTFTWNWYDYYFIVTLTLKDISNNIKYQRKHGVFVIPYNFMDVFNPSPSLRVWAGLFTDEQHIYKYTTDYCTPTEHIMQYIDAEQGKGMDFYFTSYIESGDYLEVTTTIQCMRDKYPFVTNSYRFPSTIEELQRGDSHEAYEPSQFTYPSPSSLQTKVNVYGNASQFEIRSNSPVTLERLFQAEKPFSILLKYSKFCNLVWLVDDDKKTITVYERSQHFYECMNQSGALPETGDPKTPITGILNITANVDTSQSVELTPIDWGNKYLYLNFTEAETDYLKEYHDKFKRTYGSKMLVTPNKRTDETKEMFGNGDNDTVTESCDVAPYFISIGSALAGTPTAYQADTLLLNSKDNNAAGADVHGQFVFRNSNGRWLQEMTANYRDGVLISDDSQFEITNQKYYYHGNKSGTDCTTIYKPVFSPINTADNVAFWFAFPRTAYAPLNYAQNTATLFEKWAEWLCEMYDITNKTLQCNIFITDSMYRRLKLNPLVQIDNMVYIMVEMQNYNEKTQWTKCTLKQFASVANLTAGAMPNGGLLEINLWQWDDGDFVTFDDNDNVLIGDGVYRLPNPPRPYNPIWADDPTLILPDTPTDIVRTQGNSNVYVPL